MDPDPRHTASDIQRRRIMFADITHFLEAGDIRQFFDLRDARQLDRTKPRSTPAFDVTFALVTLLAIVGLWLDVWSHVTTVRTSRSSVNITCCSIRPQ